MFCVSLLYSFLDEGFDLIIDFKIWVLFIFVFHCESLEILQSELGF